MKFIALGALVAAVSSLRTTREESHETIFQSCTTSSEYPDGKYCNVQSPIGWSTAWIAHIFRTALEEDDLYS